MNVGTFATAAPPPETASQVAGPDAGRQLPPADRAAHAPRQPHFDGARKDGQTKNRVANSCTGGRWLLAMARMITPMPLMTGHAAIAAGDLQRLSDTCAAAPGDLAWRALGAIPLLLPWRTRSHIH